jgi:hypothetical protein
VEDQGVATEFWPRSGMRPRAPWSSHRPAPSSPSPSGTGWALSSLRRGQRAVRLPTIGDERDERILAESEAHSMIALTTHKRDQVSS